MRTKSSTRRSNVTGLNAREPRAEEWALPKSVVSGSVSVKKIACVLDVRRQLLRAKEGRI